MKLVATDVTVVVLKDTGHWILEERAKYPKLRFAKVTQLLLFRAGPTMASCCVSIQARKLYHLPRIRNQSPIP
jgi:hypothetical protein